MNGLTEERLKMERKITAAISKDDTLKSFYEYMVINDEALTSIYNNLTKVKAFLTAVKKPVNKICLEDFSGYLFLKRSSESGEVFTSSYKRGIYYALKKFGEYMEFMGIVAENPMNKIKPPAKKDSQKTIEKRNKGVLTKDEITAVLSKIDDSTPRRKKWKNRDKVIFEVFLITGIRCSALYKLDVQSVDVENHTLIVTDKGSKVKRYAIPSALVEDIKYWLQDRNSILGEKTEEALFISSHLTRMSKQNIEKIIKKYSESSLGRAVSPHKLRATFGTQLYLATKDIYMVKECMNHTNIETTELYIREQEDKTKEAGDIIIKTIF